MSAEEVAATRLIMHTAGVVGAAAAAHTEWANKARAMLSPRSGATPHPSTTSEGVTAMFLRAAREDAGTLRRLSGRNTEQVTLGIHLSLLGVQGVEAMGATTAMMAGKGVSGVVER